jgi:hypothetical protein
MFVRAIHRVVKSEKILVIRRFLSSVREVTVCTLEDLTELYLATRADKKSLQERS